MSMLKTNYVKGQKAKKSFQFNSLTPKLFSLVFSPIWRKKKKTKWARMENYQAPPIFSPNFFNQTSFSSLFSVISFLPSLFHQTKWSLRLLVHYMKVVKLYNDQLFSYCHQIIYNKITHYISSCLNHMTNHL